MATAACRGRRPARWAKDLASRRELECLIDGRTAKPSSSFRSRSDRFGYIDSLRGIAALLVIYLHLADHFLHTEPNLGALDRWSFVALTEVIDIGKVRGDRVLRDLRLRHSLFVDEADGPCGPALRHRPIFPALSGLLAVASGRARDPRRRRAPAHRCAAGRRQRDHAPAVLRHRERPRHLLDAADRADLLRPLRRALRHRTAAEDEIHLLGLRHLPGLSRWSWLQCASTAA